MALEQEVEEVVMESTRNIWKPVWGSAERHWTPLRPEEGRRKPEVGKRCIWPGAIHRGRRGRKRDFPDAERL